MIRLSLESDYNGLIDLWKEAFGDSDAFLDDFDRTAFSPERYCAIIIESEVVSALYFFDCEYEGGRLAYIYAVATAKDYRGQGLCRKLLDDLKACAFVDRTLLSNYASNDFHRVYVVEIEQAFIK